MHFLHERQEIKESRERGRKGSEEGSKASTNHLNHFFELQFRVDEQGMAAKDSRQPSQPAMQLANQSQQASTAVSQQARWQASQPVSLFVGSPRHSKAQATVTACGGRHYDLQLFIFLTFSSHIFSSNCHTLRVQMLAHIQIHSAHLGRGGLWAAFECYVMSQSILGWKALVCDYMGPYQVGGRR